MTTPKRAKDGNRGRFRKGHDPRRHRFTRAECQAGFWAALISIVTRYPTAIDSAGRHMAVKFLHAAGRLNDNKEKQR